jgi:L-alanine-DL-glutamate epimerase-like enolase superfamily enzyme
VPAVERVDVSTYTIPTDAPEGDGTLLWDSTTVVVVQVRVGATVGTGWTYGPPAVGAVVASELAPLVVSTDPMDLGGTVAHLHRQARNMTTSGVVGYAISAVDVALWDLKARLLDLPLHHLLGAVRRSVPVYGSGGFVTYDEGQLRDQLSGWVAAQRIPRVKIKIGQDWGTRTDRDLARIGAARSVIGPDVELYVDANGAYTAKQAIRLMADAAEANVTWLEEPVSSQDLAGLREVRRAVTADVAAGEYVPDVYEARRLCAAGAVDCLQLDASRCGGITEFLRGAAVAASYGLDVSAHCGPHLHAAVCAAVPNARHIEWFHDHVRIESMLFDGTLDPAGGTIAPRDDRAGHGLQLRADHAREWLAGPPQFVTSPAT